MYNIKGVNKMKQKNKALNVIINFILVIGVFFCALFTVFKLTFVKVVVNGPSMNPTIIDGSKGYMVKVNKNTNIERFDVVAGFYNSDDYLIIKRVLGLPNEHVRLIDNRLFINDEEVIQEFSFKPKGINFSITEWTLKEDEYLLVGDNRANTIAPVVTLKDDIIAKNGFAIAIYDIYSETCVGNEDYTTCPILERKWYWFKDGK